MDNITDEAKLDPRAWGYQYQQQQKLLVFDDYLPEEVRSAFRRYLPIEQKLPKFDEMKQQDEARESIEWLMVDTSKLDFLIAKRSALNGVLHRWETWVADPWE